MAQLTARERATARKVQDELIALAERWQIPDSMRVSSSMPEGVTLGTLRTVIYPEHIETLRTVIDMLRQGH